MPPPFVLLIPMIGNLHNVSAQCALTNTDAQLIIIIVFKLLCCAKGVIDELQNKVY